MKDEKQGVQLSQAEMDIIKNNPLRCREIYWAMANSLRGWGMRNAFDGGIMTAVVYISFLKFVSDRRDILKLNVSDNYRFDALCRLYPDVVSQEQILHYMMDVEEQLGLGGGLLGGILFPRQGLEFDRKFLDAMRIAEGLDFTTESAKETYVDALMAMVIELANENGKTSGVSFTPYPTSDLMGKLLKVEDGMSVYDPCAGIGIMLEKIVRNKRVDLYAQEVNSTSAAILEMLLIMNGMNKGWVACNDSIWNPLSMEMQYSFDRVICDPPYLKPAIGYRNTTMTLLVSQILYYPEERIEDTWIFVRHIAATLKEDGRAVVIVPMSMLTREGSAGRTRQRLVEDGYIDSVVELPGGAYPNTGVKTSILVIEKGKPGKDIFFLDLSRGGWDGKSICDDRMIEIALSHTSQDGLSGWASFEEIQKNGFQLAAARYIQQNINMEQFLSDSVKLYERADELEKKYASLCRNFREELEEYNHYLNEEAGAYDN